MKELLKMTFRGNDYIKKNLNQDLKVLTLPF